MRYKMKKIFLLVVVTLSSYVVHAQQDVLLSQYMFNHLVINPGYAGSKDYMMATLLYRKQWVGWTGAPESQALSLHGPLRNKNLGFGVSLLNDHIGVTSRVDLYGDLAYHLKLNQKLKIGFGLQGGFAYYSYKNSDLLYWEQNDKVYAESTQTNILPNVGAGAFLYAEKFYVGLSVPHMLDYNTKKGLSIQSASIVPHQTRHYFVSGGFVFTANPDVIIRPSVLLKYVPSAPLEADFNVNVMFMRTFWIGVSYRTNDATVAIFELQLSRKLRIGYSYDFTMTDINDYSSGSHEIMLGYDFGHDLVKMRTPRYF